MIEVFHFIFLDQIQFLSGIKMFMLKIDMLHRYEFFLELQCPWWRWTCCIDRRFVLELKCSCWRWTCCIGTNFVRNYNVYDEHGHVVLVRMLSRFAMFMMKIDEVSSFYHDVYNKIVKIISLKVHNHTMTYI